MDQLLENSYTILTGLCGAILISKLEGKLRDETCHRDDSTLKKDKTVGVGGFCSRGWDFGGVEDQSD